MSSLDNNKLQHDQPGDRFDFSAIRPMNVTALLLLFALNLSATHASLTAQVTLEIKPWPQRSECVACIPLQFGHLDMQLPLTEVGKVFVFDRGNPAVMLAPPSGNVLEGMSLMAMPEERLFARYRRPGFFEQHGIDTVEQFYDAVGAPSGAEIVGTGSKNRAERPCRQPYQNLERRHPRLSNRCRPARCPRVFCDRRRQLDLHPGRSGIATSVRRDSRQSAYRQDPLKTS